MTNGQITPNRSHFSSRTDHAQVISGEPRVEYLLILGYFTTLFLSIAQVIRGCIQKLPD